MRPTEQRALRILRLRRLRASVRSPSARGSAPVVAAVAVVAEVAAEVAEAVVAEVVAVVAEAVAEAVAEVVVAEAVEVAVAEVAVVAVAVAAVSSSVSTLAERGRGAVTAAGGDDRVPDERGSGEGALRVQGRLR